MGKVSWTNDTKIQTEKLKTAFESKIVELKDACTAAIYSGFKSTSTGFEFGFNELDQTNFTQQLLLIVVSGGPQAYPGRIEWKTKSGNVEEISAAEFIDLVNEAEAHKRAQQRKYWALEILVKAASSAEEVAAIKW